MRLGQRYSFLPSPPRASSSSSPSQPEKRRRPRLSRPLLLRRPNRVVLLRETPRKHAPACCCERCLYTSPAPAKQTSETSERARPSPTSSSSSSSSSSNEGDGSESSVDSSKSTGVYPPQDTTSLKKKSDLGQLLMGLDRREMATSPTSREAAAMNASLVSPQATQRNEWESSGSSTSSRSFKSLVDNSLEGPSGEDEDNSVSDNRVSPIQPTTYGPDSLTLIAKDKQVPNNLGIPNIPHKDATSTIRSVLSAVEYVLELSAEERDSARAACSGDAPLLYGKGDDNIVVPFEEENQDPPVPVPIISFVKFSLLSDRQEDEFLDLLGGGGGGGAGISRGNINSSREPRGSAACIIPSTSPCPSDSEAGTMDTKGTFQPLTPTSQHVADLETHAVIIRDVVRHKYNKLKHRDTRNGNQFSSVFHLRKGRRQVMWARIACSMCCVSFGVVVPGGWVGWWWSIQARHSLVVPATTIVLKRPPLASYPPHSTENGTLLESTVILPPTERMICGQKGADKGLNKRRAMGTSAPEGTVPPAHCSITIE